MAEREFHLARRGQQKKVAELLVNCFDNFKLMELDNPQLSKLNETVSNLVLERIRGDLFKNTRTVRSLGRTFSVMDSDGNRLLDKQEFYWGLKNLGCTISKKEAGLLLE